MTARASTLGGQLHDQAGEIERRITGAYERLYSRRPEPPEIELATRWLGESPVRENWDRYAQVLLSAHELIQIR
jgi:hypothetical protein